MPSAPRRAPARNLPFDDSGGLDILPRAWETPFHWLQERKLTAAGINREVYGATEDADLYAVLS